MFAYVCNMAHGHSSAKPCKTHQHPTSSSKCQPRRLLPDMEATSLHCVSVLYTWFQRCTINFSKLYVNVERSTIFDHVLNVSRWCSRCYTALLNQLSVTQVFWLFGLSAQSRGFTNVRSVQITNHWRIVDMRNQWGTIPHIPDVPQQQAKNKRSKNQVCIQHNKTALWLSPWTTALRYHVHWTLGYCMLLRRALMRGFSSGV